MEYCKLEFSNSSKTGNVNLIDTFEITQPAVT